MQLLFISQVPFSMIFVKQVLLGLSRIFPGIEKPFPGMKVQKFPGNSREASLYVPNMQNPGFDRHLSYGVILVWTSKLVCRFLP
jgi:hypothetical protein